MRERQEEASYVVQTIAAFRDGLGSEWDWDDFTSFPLHDPTLDSIRRRALAIRLPADDDGEAVLSGLLAEAEQVMREGSERPAGARQSVELAHPFARRAIIWLLAYFWTAGAALAISDTAGWQYDGDLGWWAVVAHSFPALALASPILWLFGPDNRGIAACLAALTVLTVAAILVFRRVAQRLDGG